MGQANECGNEESSEHREERTPKGQTQYTYDELCMICANKQLSTQRQRAKRVQKQNSIRHSLLLLQTQREQVKSPMNP
jgi:hypothetical protein